jgi:hypothetical protein
MPTVQLAIWLVIWLFGLFGYLAVCLLADLTICLFCLLVVDSAFQVTDFMQIKNTIRHPVFHA